MKSILIVDDMHAPRSRAHLDMYWVMVQQMGAHACLPENVAERITQTQYDVLFFGMYHPWQVIDWEAVVAFHKGRIILDQSDNEEYLSFIDRVLYLKDYPDKVLTSRYLPNKAASRAAKLLQCEVRPLPWFVNKDRFRPRTKEIGVSFACTMNERRMLWREQLKEHSAERYQAVTEPLHGTIYPELMSLSEICLIECDRRCMTLKYIEAVLSGCKIVGDKPKYPANEIKGEWVRQDNVAQAIERAAKQTTPDNLNAIEAYIDPERLIDNLNNLMQ